MMRTKFVAALAAGLLAMPMAASADIVTQLIHFDDANNGWGWYSDKDLNFLFNPTTLQSSSHCADRTSSSGPANGHCVIETNNGPLPRMTRPEFGPQSQGEPGNVAPIVSGTDQKFTLNSFYFWLDGNGSVPDNYMKVEGSNGVSFIFGLGSDYDLAGVPDVTFYENSSAGSAGQLAGPLVKGTGYIASFGALFTDVTWIQFSAAGDAQSRLDCVVATFDGITTEGLKPGTTCGLGNGGPPPTDLPEPGTLGLLSLALLGLGFAGRRRVN